MQSPFTRKFALCSLFLLLSLLTTHCGRANEQLAEVREPAELLWVSFDINSQLEQTLAENYRTEHPEITFDFQQNTFNRDYFSSTPAPDLLMSFVNRDFAQASRTNKLADLSEVWTAAALDEKLITNVQQLIRNPQSGEPLMLPIAFAWAGIYYNKAIFAQYNLQTPQTWEEFIHICATLQANGETPLAMPGSQSYAHTLWFDYLNLRINGAEYHRALLAGSERYDDPRISIVLETWRSLFEQGFVVERPEMMNEQAAINALIRGDSGMLGGEKAVMVLMDTYLISQTHPNFRDEFDFFRFPLIDPSIPPAEPIDVIGYVIPAAAGHGAQAQSFLAYLGLPEAQELIAREAAVINAVFAPVRADLDPTAITPDMDKAISMLQETAEVVPFTFQWMPNEMWVVLSRASQQLLTNNYEIHGFMNTLEQARQEAREEGVLE